MCLICCNCGSCGKALPDEVLAFYSAPKQCLGCGATLEEHARCCPACGRESVLPPGTKATKGSLVKHGSMT